MGKAIDVATDNYLKVSPDESIFECGKLMGGSQKKYVVVVENNAIQGIVQGISLIKYLIDGKISENTIARNVMTKLVQVDVSSDLEDVLNIMIDTKSSQLQIGNKIIDKDSLLEYIYLKNKL